MDSDSSTSYSSSGESPVFARRQLFANGRCLPDKIRVFSRLRPHESLQTSSFNVNGQVLSTNEDVRGVVKTISYTFSGIFNDDAEQVEVFNSVALPAVKLLLGGKDGLLFSYGTTSSGKTFTVQGTGQKPGLIPRTIFSVFCNLEKYLESNESLCPHFSSTVTQLSPSELFAMDESRHVMLLEMLKTESEADCNSSLNGWNLENLAHLIVPTIQKLRVDKQFRYSVWVTFFEIYQENIYDLLVENSEVQTFTSSSSVTTDKRTRLQLGQEPKSKFYYVKGLKHYCVRSWVEAIRLFFYGKKRLHVNETVLNRASSRSHSVFTIKVVSRRIDGLETPKISSFSVCDLAGCERSKKLYVTGVKMKETNHINKSIMVLNRCLEVIRNNQKQKSTSIVPFRDSKLTKIFQKSLLSGENITMIVNISQNPELYEESRQVLRASSIAQDIKLLNPNKYIPKNPRMSVLFLAPAGGISVDALSLSQFSGNNSATSLIHPCNKCQELAVDYKSKESNLLNLLEEAVKEKKMLKKEILLSRQNQFLLEGAGSSDFQVPTSARGESTETRNANLLQEEITLLKTENAALKSKNSALTAEIDELRRNEVSPELLQEFREEIVSYVELLKEKDVLISQKENEIENYKLKLAVYERSNSPTSYDSDTDEKEEEDEEETKVENKSEVGLSMFSHSDVVVSSTLICNQAEEVRAPLPDESGKKWNLRSHKNDTKQPAAGMQGECTSSSDGEFLPLSSTKKKCARGKGTTKPKNIADQYVVDKNKKDTGKNSGNPSGRRQLYNENVMADEVTDLFCGFEVKSPEISPLSELRRKNN